MDRWPTKDHEAPFWVGICIPLFLIADGSRWRARAGCLIFTLEITFDEVALFKGVFDPLAMVVAWQLDYLVKTDMVELASLLLVRCLWTPSTSVTNSLSQCL
jgi:hypothetical protein